MIERELLLSATASLLVLAYLWRQVPARLIPGRRALLYAAGGCLLPLLDLPVNFVLSADRLDLLSRPPLFSSPLPAVLLIGVGAWLAVQVAPWERVLRNAAATAAGFVVHLLLAWLTPAGVALLAPFSAERFSLPVFPIGHPPLLVILFAGLVFQERLMRRFNWARPVLMGLVGFYFFLGLVLFSATHLSAVPLRGKDGTVHVYPEGSWMTAWRVVVEKPESYELRRLSLNGFRMGPPREIGRWNDQALFLKLLGDPIVRRFYHRVFRHPVARIETSGTQVILDIHELFDDRGQTPHRTFSLETDLGGRNRFYRLYNFN